MYKPEIIKKYPIIHEGKEYEVRWKTGERLYEIVVLYEVVRTFLGFKKYILKHARREMDLRWDNNLSTNDPELYIKEATILFKSWCNHMDYRKKEEQTKQAQLSALQNWDGIIE